MQPRAKGLTALAAFGMLVAGGLLLAGGLGLAATAPARIAFQIATGATGGSYFPVGQAIAGLVSHPPGVDRCEAANVCGPSGLIISVRTSAGDVDNLQQINNGAVDSGFAQADAVADAVAGTGAFVRPGKLTHIRAVAALFTEHVHLVATVKSGIKDVSGLRGQRVSLGAEGSGANIAALEILHAWNLPVWRLRIQHETVENDVALMQSGKLDAFFVVGGLPDPALGDLLGRGVAKLVPIDGTRRDRLLKQAAGLSSAVIPAGTYPNTGALQTVATRAIWVVRDLEPEAIIYGITRALFNPANRAALAASYPSASEISLDAASRNLPAPLHPGAARYFQQTGRLPKTN